MRVMTWQPGWIAYALPAAIVVLAVALRLWLGGRIGRLKSGGLWIVPAVILAVFAYSFVHARSLGWDKLAIPVAQPQVWLFQALAVAFVALIVVAAMRRKDEGGARQDGRSRVGIAIQGAAFVLAGFGPVKATLPPLSVPAVAGFALVLLLMAAVLGLFAASSSALGRNWSIKARTLADHELIRSGPYAFVRHPIYLAMLLFLLAMVIALGHWALLIVALPIFLVGTRMRTTAEDRLLEESFGQDFVDYCNSTPALFPRIG
jgi:protein-S-isoprenylcysteine O-methyltransferase Ste14